MTVRRAEAGDAQRIAEIHISGWRAAYRGLLADAFLFGKLSIGRRAENVARELAEGPGEYYIAERDGFAAAFMVIGPSRDADKAAGDCFELWALYAQPELRRTGLGGELMAFFEAEALRRGMRAACTWVLEGNTGAIAFYNKHGYRADGARKTLERLPAVTGTAAEFRLVKPLAANPVN